MFSIREWLHTNQYAKCTFVDPILMPVIYSLLSSSGLDLGMTHGWVWVKTIEYHGGCVEHHGG
jgi:hypothetical protein